MTLRSYRSLALMAFGAAFCAYLFFWCLNLTISGELPDYSFGRLLGVGVIMVGALYLSFACAMSLRKRVVIGEDGIDIVHTFKREHLPWDEITDVSTGFKGRFWDVEVQAGGKKRLLLLVPVSVFHGTEHGERYAHAPPQAPRRLRTQYAYLRETWEAHHRGETTTTSP
ncbi:PH domain-containing protein [Spirillospora sp. NPDC048819]|uniref:PH domain-containing protein n=1 Tax=Spirillospora sp. NPDC048819 TaxID=3155268 RepID=UPI0033CD6C48